jgi:tRNA (mo5U34)-methyltransferase
MVPLPQLDLFSRTAVTNESVLATRYAPVTGFVPEWRSLDGLEDSFAARLTAHGDFARWYAALASMPIPREPLLQGNDVVSVRGRLTLVERNALELGLRALEPWRKGPFELCGIAVDSEWRSDFKWRRVAPHVELSGRRVLDVGCGNGYFGWRALDAGATLVVGVDPGVLYCMQHLAIAALAGRTDNWVLPATFEDLPAARFDVVFSMGVIYHRRDPNAHLVRLLEFLAPGGVLVVESLVVEGRDPLVPGGRYARMNNVHWIPTVDVLVSAVRAAGAADVRIVDVTATTTDEQRTTAWMRSQSLAHALDPIEPSRTVEGHPAPRRAVLVARRQGPATGLG